MNPRLRRILFSVLVIGLIAHASVSVLQSLLGEGSHPRHQAPAQPAAQRSEPDPDLNRDDRQSFTEALNQQLLSELCLVSEAPFRDCYQLNEAQCRSEFAESFSACQEHPEFAAVIDLEDLGSRIGDCVNDRFFSKFKGQVKLELDSCSSLIAESSSQSTEKGR